MKPGANKTPEQLLATARQLPLEMDLARIELIVSDFSAAGPAPQDPYRGSAADAFPLTKLLTLAGLVATAGLLLLYLPDGSPPDMTAALAAPQSVVSPAEASEIPAKKRKTVVVPPEPALQTNPAPAYSPKSNLASRQSAGLAAGQPAPRQPIQKIPPATLEPLIFNASTIIEAPAGLPFGPTLLTGTWHWDGAPGTAVRLEYSERVGGKRITWQLFPRFSAAELERLNAAVQDPIIERETGRVRLSLADREFSYQARTALRERYESKGWGTRSAPPTEVRLQGSVNDRLADGEVVSNRPADILWLRYFTQNVGEEYFDLLGNVGLRRTELSQTWQLVNRGMDQSSLRKLNEWLTASDFPRNDIDVNILLDMQEERLLLKELSNRGYTLSAEKWSAIRDARLTVGYLKAIHDDRAGPYPLPDLLAVYRANIPETHAREMLAADYEGTTLEGAIEAYEPPASELQRSGIEISFGEEGDGRQERTRTESLPAFDRLIVMDGFEVSVIKGDTNRATITLDYEDWVDVKLSVDKKGTLQIYEKLPFLTNIIGRKQAKIVLEVTDLKRVHARSHARVTVSPDVGVKKWSVYGKGEVRVAPVGAPAERKE